MAFGYIQGASGLGSGVTFSATLAAPATQNNLLVVNIKIGSTSETVTSVTDDKGNVYAKAAGPRNNSFAGYQYYGVQVIPGATVITVTKTGAVNSSRIAVDEFSGAASTNAAVFDKAGTEALSGTSSALTTPVAPAAAGELIVSGVSFSAAPTGVTAAANYVLGSSNTTQVTQYRLNSATSETASMTWTGSTSWVNVVGAYLARTNNAGLMAFM